MSDPGTDPLSALARQILQARPEAFRELDGPSEAPRETIALLANVDPAQLFDHPIRSAPAAQAVLAGLWLWHDGLHECHRIVQKDPAEYRDATSTPRPDAPSSSPKVSLAPFSEPDKSTDPAHLREMTETFAFWHAIMHRREGDFGNSKYWYAHCREHLLLHTLAAQANEIIAKAPAEKTLLRLTMSGWNGSAFVDYVQSVHESPSDPRYEIAAALQQMEWRSLFDHCVRQATGK